MDRLIIERWADVVGLVDAHNETQDRIEQMIETVGGRLGRWAHAYGFEIETEARWAEFKAAKTSWIDKRKGARVQLALGGFCPAGYKKMEADHPYLCLYVNRLSENFRVKEPEVLDFSRGLRSSLGADSRLWDAPGVDDTTEPLIQYMVSISDSDRAKLIAAEDSLFDFATERLPTLFGLAEHIDSELAKLSR